MNLRGTNIKPKEVLKNQINFKSDLGEMKKIPKSKTENQISVIQNVQNVFDLRDKIIDFFRDYSLLVSEAKYRAKYGRDLKILTPQQMLQRLSKALAQVKAGSTVENLLNEVRQIIHSLYREKEVTKKICNNIMNSIKL